MGFTKKDTEKTIMTMLAETEPMLNWTEQDDTPEKPVVYIPETLYISYGRTIIPVH